MKIKTIYSNVKRFPFLVYPPALEQEVVVVDKDRDFILTDFEGNHIAYAADFFEATLIDSLSNGGTMRYTELIAGLCKVCAPHFGADCRCNF